MMIMEQENFPEIGELQERKKANLKKHSDEYVVSEWERERKSINGKVVLLICAQRQ
jgi:hypothetical protein